MSNYFDHSLVVVVVVVVVKSYTTYAYSKKNVAEIKHELR